MLITDFKVSIAKNGNGTITYTKNKKNYKVLLSKEDKVIKEIFNLYYNQLSSFKHRHYAIAKWIARDLRAKGYMFKSYANNKMNIRPVKRNKEVFRSCKDIYEQQLMENLHRREMEMEILDFERMIH